MNPKPLWRWWLFCLALSLWFRFQWNWLGDLFNWCVLPEWLGHDAAYDRLDAVTGRDEVEW